MPQNICFMVLIGLPAAGKSTFCRRLLETHQKYFNIIHICYDDFLEFHQLTTQQESSTLDYIYKAQRIEIYKTLEIIANALASSKKIPPNILQKIEISAETASSGDFIILCDDNHYYRSMRYKIFQLCKAQSYAYSQIYFDCEQKLSLERNAQRSTETRLPEHVITQMATRLETPLASNIWETSTLTIYAANLKFSADAVIQLAFKALKDILDSKTVTKSVDYLANEEQLASSIHKLDIKLRRRISELLQSDNSKECKHSKAIQLNMKRKNILQQCRENVNLDESDLNIYVDLLNENLK